MKVFYVAIKIRRVLAIGVVALLALLFFVIQSIRTGFLGYEIGSLVVLLLNVFLGISLFSFYKTRIEVDDREIYCPCYPWYQDFKMELDESPMFKTILLSDIDSIKMIDVTGAAGEAERAIHIKIKNKYDIVIPLDGYSTDKQQEIWTFIVRKSGL